MKGVVPVRDLGPVDVTALAARVVSLPEAAWNADLYRQQAFEVHRATRSIRLLWTALDAWPDVEARPTDAFPPFEDDLYRLFVAVAARLGRPAALMNAILARLDPGGEIAPHVDSAPFFAHCHRIHVPMQTNDAAALVVDDIPHHLEVGRAYELDNRRLHAATNGGDTPRVHLILDLASG